MTTDVIPVREPLRATFIRNGLIALVAGSVLALATSRSPRPVPWMAAVVLMLWPSFGGHVLEVWYRNWLAARLPASRTAHVIARLATWFVGGCALGVGMMLTSRALGVARSPAWWIAGVAFIVIELVAHSGLTARGEPSFLNGRG